MTKVIRSLHYIVGMVLAVLLANQRSIAGESFAIIGDAGRWNSDAKMVLESIQKSKIQRLIVPGDNLYDLTQTYEAVWAPWKKAGFLFDLVAIGNHHLSYAKEIEFFKMPGEYYARTLGGARFLVINSDNQNTATAQVQWLEKELQSAKEKLIFLVLHHPPFTATRFHNWKERAAILGPVRGLLDRYRGKLTAVLAGHDHIASVIDIGGLPMVISGAAQDQRTDEVMNYQEEGKKIRTLWLYPGTAHWAKLSVDSGSGQVWVNFISPLRGETCAARLAPLPVQMLSNCASTGRAGSALASVNNP